LSLGEHDLRVIGAAAGNALGTSVAAGDVNDDGRDDVLLGAPIADAFIGEAYVIYAADDWGVSAIGLGEYNLKVHGADVGDGLGSTLTTGDLNNNGRVDVLVGADFADGPMNGRQSAGEVYIIFGPQSASPTPPPGASATPTAPGGGGGDVNKDGETNAIDAALILQQVAGIIESVAHPENADVNEDGEIDAIDAALVLQFAAGLIDDLPV
jgi:hypothetical protein